MSDSIRNLRGTLQLTFDCLSGITNAVTQVHGAVAKRTALTSPRFANDQPTPGAISGTVYSGVQSIIHGLREGAERSFSLFADESTATPGSVERGLAFRSVLNGVCGDHLENTKNVLATQMCFTTPAVILNLSKASIESAIPKASPDIAVYVHGLCLSAESWSRNKSSSIGDKLKESAGLTPVYLQYNTGRHISTNGQGLATQLNRLINAWPVPVKSVSLIGHSMGGLVIRSACWYAEKQGYDWPQRLKRVLFLGTPHHGAPLEKAGHLLTKTMKASPYLSPLDFGRHRSAGIKDLRFGNLLDEDWHAGCPDKASTDARCPVPLLTAVEYYFIAATIGRGKHDLLGNTFGDLLVRSGSAIGYHPDRQRALDINPENCRILHRRTHFDLLSDSAVHDQITRWFKRV